MKGPLLTLTMLAALTTCEQKSEPAPVDYGRVREMEQQRIALQEHLVEQDRRLSRWQIATMIFGIGCPILLLIGASLGSKAKRDGN